MAGGTQFFFFFFFLQDLSGEGLTYYTYKKWLFLKCNQINQCYSTLHNAAVPHKIKFFKASYKSFFLESDNVNISIIFNFVFANTCMYIIEHLQNFFFNNVSDMYTNVIFLIVHIYT